jgi:hypothetical protein
MLKLSAKCWISAFNAQGSRRIIVPAQVGAVENVCSSSGGAQERQGETQETIFLSFTSHWMLMYFFAGCFFNLTLCMTKLGVLALSFPDFTDISNS